jgi:transcriptional regulator with XRE-family HTH domain
MLRLSATPQFLYGQSPACYVPGVNVQRRDGLAEELRARAEQAGWTPWQLARRIHQDARTPTLLMAWRLAAGLTQAELANCLRRLAIDAGSPCSPSTPSCQQISRWENGHDRPGGFYQGLLSAWYRTDPARLGLIGDPRLTAEQGLPPDTASTEDDVNRRTFLLVATPVLSWLDQIRRRMDTDLRHVLPAAEADHWTQIADQHVAAYGTLPPGTLLARLAPDLSDLADLAGQYPQQRDITLLAARLCGLTGALHTDLGDDRAARGWLHTAGRHAMMSGDVTTRYWVAMAQAMTATYPPDPGRVLTIIGKATAELGHCSCAAAVQLTGLAARAYAGLGDSRAARRQLAVAEHVASGLSAAQANERFFGFPLREMMMYTSQVLTSTGDPAAWNAQTLALSCYPASDTMDRPLLLLGRACHLARHGEPDQAAHVAASAITTLAPAWRVPLLISEARAVGKAISAASAQAGRQYAETLREEIPAQPGYVVRPGA